MVKGAKEAGLVISFRSPCSASAAIDLGRGLLGQASVADALTVERVKNLREHSIGAYVPLKRPENGAGGWQGFDMEMGNLQELKLSSLSSVA